MASSFRFEQPGRVTISIRREGRLVLQWGVPLADQALLPYELGASAAGHGFEDCLRQIPTRRTRKKDEPGRPRPLARPSRCAFCASGIRLQVASTAPSGCQRKRFRSDGIGRKALVRHGAAAFRSRSFFVTGDEQCVDCQGEGHGLDSRVHSDAAHLQFSSPSRRLRRAVFVFSSTL